MGDRKAGKSAKRSLAAATGIALAAMIFLAARTGLKNATAPARCPTEAIATGSRCCSPGQAFDRGFCAGPPKSCPTGFERRDSACIVRPKRVRIAPGKVYIGPGDWEDQGVVQPRDVTIEVAFQIDAFEVTVDRWSRCVEAGACPNRTGERGSPVRGISFLEAERFCRWAGGDVPSENAWILVAAGTTANRYPWGNTGAVCRRADWGRFDGPCASGGSQPEWAGLIASDTTPAGVNGMAGGVSEWVRSHQGPTVRGGSFRSRLATELRTWRRDERDTAGTYDDVGVRCMYQE